MKKGWLFVRIEKKFFYWIGFKDFGFWIGKKGKKIILIKKKFGLRRLWYNEFWCDFM